MKAETIRKLNQLNEDFYNQVAKPFSQTRQHSWKGWEKVVEILKNQALPETIKILDVGCGNGRFGAYLAEQLPQQKINYVGIDNNQSLLNEAKSTLKDKINSLHLIKVNVVNQLLLFEDILPESDFNLIVAFGVLHHIPGQELRKRFLTILANKLKPSGMAVVTAWQFFNDEKLRSKMVEPSIADIELDELESHDYILSWDREVLAYRYCHFADRYEMESLTAEIPLHKTFFLADGKNDTLNQYLILTSNPTITSQIGQ